MWKQESYFFLYNLSFVILYLNIDFVIKFAIKKIYTREINKNHNSNCAFQFKLLTQYKGLLIYIFLAYWSHS